MGMQLGPCILPPPYKNIRSAYYQGLESSNSSNQFSFILNCMHYAQSVVLQQKKKLTNQESFQNIARQSKLFCLFVLSLSIRHNGGPEMLNSISQVCFTAWNYSCLAVPEIAGTSTGPKCGPWREFTAVMQVHPWWTWIQSVFESMIMPF